MSEVIIYQTVDNQTEIEVKFDNDTVWLSQKQMSELFDKNSDTIGLHIKNIYNERELDQNSTAEEYSVVQREGNRNIKRNIKLYNLDVIISVGYRVKSKRGTQFRIWATKRLKEILTQGYSMNLKRLEQLRQTVQIIQQSAQDTNFSANETKGLLDIISNYTQSFILLNKFDSNKLTIDFGEEVTYKIEYDEALQAVETLKEKLLEQKEAGILFGNKKDDSFKGILSSVIQTFDGYYLYDTIEKQA
ncbi:MAG: virulence RhuM family protein, partial [Bacteroidetes bacterium]|nr:virulence RhuM family protein [Bacteroidota bacterium]